MKVKEQQIVYTRYVTMETVNGDVHYRTDWTGVWEVLKDERWEPVDDTENLQNALTEYLLTEYSKAQRRHRTEKAQK